jgi:hypothetical protein
VEKKKIYKLDVSNKSPVWLLGILTDETDLKLSWILNKSLQVKLSRDEDINWLSKELPSPLAFPIYSDPASRYGHLRLLKNRTLGGLWIKGYKQVDYLLIVTENISSNTREELMEKVQHLDGVRGVYVLNPAPIEHWMV